MWGEIDAHREDGERVGGNAGPLSVGERRRGGEGLWVAPFYIRGGVAPTRGVGSRLGPVVKQATSAGCDPIQSLTGCSAEFGRMTIKSVALSGTTKALTLVRPVYASCVLGNPPRVDGHSGPGSYLWSVRLPVVRCGGTRASSRLMAIARVCKVVSAFGRSDLGQRIGDCRDQGVVGPGSSFSQQRLDLGEELLDRIEIGAVRG
jgi:hypothetical protein